MCILIGLLCHVELLQCSHEGQPDAVLEVVDVCCVTDTAPGPVHSVTPLWWEDEGHVSNQQWSSVRQITKIDTWLHDDAGCRWLTVGSPETSLESVCTATAWQQS